VDNDDETGLRYINPSLVLPLEDVWLAKERRNRNGSAGRNGEEEV
jgi:hypothetical protein